jgi:hypothetical protein
MLEEDAEWPAGIGKTRILVRILTFQAQVTSNKAFFFVGGCSPGQ